MKICLFKFESATTAVKWCSCNSGWQPSLMFIALLAIWTLRQVQQGILSFDTLICPKTASRRVLRSCWRILVALQSEITVQLMEKNRIHSNRWLVSTVSNCCSFRLKRWFSQRIFFSKGEIKEVHIADIAQIGRIFALSVRFAMCFHSTWGAHVTCCHVTSCCIGWSLCVWDRSLVGSARTDERIKFGYCEPYTCEGLECPDT